MTWNRPSNGRSDFHSQGETKKSWRGVFLNVHGACRLVELGQQRAGEVVFFQPVPVASVAFVQKAMWQVCLFHVMEFVLQVFISILLNIVKILDWSVPIDSTLWNF